MAKGIRSGSCVSSRFLFSIVIAYGKFPFKGCDYRIDLTCAIVNNKAVVDWCIFGRFAEENNDQVSSTFPYRECNTACQAIYQSIDYKIKSDTLSYSFCDYQGNFSTEADACTSCLYNSTGLTILGNGEYDSNIVYLAGKEKLQLTYSFYSPCNRARTLQPKASQVLCL